MNRFALALALISSAATAQVATQSGTDGQNALGTIPCAAIAGEPLTSCNAELRRRDDGTTTLAVLLPTGDTRNIYFTDGVPTSSSLPVKISHEISGDTMVIFLAPGEVYEIPTAALNP